MILMCNIGIIYAQLIYVFFLNKQINQQKLFAVKSYREHIPTYVTAILIV